ncbi:calmodulin-binding family protein [Parasponia andersonii]|uniref:Calmodulin-binding family protein n=1 Tax=Parasponia andersonii TaxID=3476 RepID=A0A2P5BE87_PARAD|nr:calmodulin-binding family protein [Parasponia andersonii]
MPTVRSIEFDQSKKRERTTRTISFKKTGDLNTETDKPNGSDEMFLNEEPIRSVRRNVGKLMINASTSSFNMDEVIKNVDNWAKKVDPEISLANTETWFSPRPEKELNAAATKVQKVYKSYRTRRNLADCAVVVEELWWKALDFAALRRSSVSFFESDKSETAISKWARARTRAAKVGKGLSKYEKAQKLALRHWLEANEREAYEVIVESGKLLYKQSGVHVATLEGTKWIFVLSTSRKLYVAEKKKGFFQHSSFLAGGAIIAAGRLVVHDGVLEGIWSYSGHYCPTEENFREFISFLEEHQVDLTNVKKCPMDDDVPPSNKKLSSKSLSSGGIGIVEAINKNGHPEELEEGPKQSETEVEQPKLEVGRCFSCQWTTGTRPRISCVREYPSQLQFQALEQVHLSPRTRPNLNPVPSPRPNSKVHLSPRLSYLGLPSPRLYALSPNKKNH